MKVIVISDTRGEIESVAVPAPEFADQINVETEGGIVHKLDLDPKTVNEKGLQGHLGAEARAKAYKALLKEIRRQAARPSDG